MWATPQRQRLPTELARAVYKVAAHALSARPPLTRSTSHTPAPRPTHPPPRPKHSLQNGPLDRIPCRQRRALAGRLQTGGLDAGLLLAADRRT